MSTQDLYGFRSNDLEEARASVEAALGVELSLHDSSYHGGDYYRKNTEANDEIVLQINDDGEGWAEEDYKNYGVLLHVYSPERGDDYKKALTDRDGGFILLERSVSAPSGLLQRMRYTDGEEEIYFEKQTNDL